jgi:hypothetical protein
MNMNLFSFRTRNTTPSPKQWSMELYTKPLQMPVVPQQIVVTPPPERKVKWGPAVWFLLHTLSVKIKADQFQSVRNDLFNNIYTICTNLPCPDCSNHAKSYLDGINFSLIQTKDDLKKLLWTFHNEVNKRKGYPFYPFDKIDEVYSMAVTNNIIIHFMTHFSDRNRSLKLLATDLYRANLCKSLKEWFNNNITAFNP